MNSCSNNSSPEIHPVAHAARRSLGDLARRVRSRTTDLIAIAIVLAAGLTFGRQLVDWWQVEPTPVAVTKPAESVVGWGADGAPVTLEFGKQPLAITREVVSGSRATALESLQERCCRIVGSAPPPRRAVDTAERALLGSTGVLTPVVEKSGAWRLYQVDSQFTLVFGVKDVADQPRVVCWGMMLPQSEQAWTLFVFTESAGEAGQTTNVPTVLLPPASRKILSLRDDRGGMLIGFSGDGSPIAWSKFFDEHWTTQGCNSPTGWQQAGGHYSNRFVHESSAQVVDIQFDESPNGGFVGLINVGVK